MGRQDQQQFIDHVSSQLGGGTLHATWCGGVLGNTGSQQGLGEAGAAASRGCGARIAPGEDVMGLRGSFLTLVGDGNPLRGDEQELRVVSVMGRGVWPGDPPTPTPPWEQSGEGHGGPPGLLSSQSGTPLLGLNFRSYPAVCKCVCTYVYVCLSHRNRDRDRVCHSPMLACATLQPVIPLVRAIYHWKLVFS